MVVCVPRESESELEVDGVAADILNTHQLSLCKCKNSKIVSFLHILLSVSASVWRLSWFGGHLGRRETEEKAAGSRDFPHPSFLTWLNYLE